MGIVESLLAVRRQPYNDFDIILDHFPRVFKLHPHPTRAVGRVLLGAQSYRVLVGACNPMLCQIWGFRPRSGTWAAYLPQELAGCGRIWLWVAVTQALYLGLTFGLAVPGCPTGCEGPGTVSSFSSPFPIPKLDRGILCASTCRPTLTPANYPQIPLACPTGAVGLAVCETMTPHVCQTC